MTKTRARIVCPSARLSPFLEGKGIFSLDSLDELWSPQIDGRRS